MERNNKRKIYAVGMMCLAFCLGVFGSLELSNEDLSTSEVNKPSETWKVSVGATPSVSAESAILIDEEGKVLYEKNANAKSYPASTTKIMTALVVLETLDELGLGMDSEIIVPEEAVGIEGSSIYLKKGVPSGRCPGRRPGTS